VSGFPDLMGRSPQVRPVAGLDADRDPPPRHRAVLLWCVVASDMLLASCGQLAVPSASRAAFLRDRRAHRPA
jgi:hypothetical protein